MKKMMFPRLLHVFFLAGVAASARSPTAQFPLEPNTILTPSKSLTLDSIPLLGFGTWNLDRENATEAVSWAIQAGYRHIDCDPAHKNQELVGIGIADGLNKTGLKREDLWITSKLQNGQYAQMTFDLTASPLDKTNRINHQPQHPQENLPRPRHHPS